MSVVTPNMNLIQPTIGVDSGLTWEQDVNSNSSIIDGHNHTPGYGVLIPPAGLNINSNLTFQNNQATNLQACAFTAQTSVTTLDAIYVKGVDLYYRDGSNNEIQITTGGTVNATSSGITSGTATASFVSSVLVVNAASTTPANIKAGSILIGNNSAGSKYLTLAPPASMAANITETLPTIPGATSFMQMDSGGNMAASIAITGALTTSNLSATAGILGTQIAAGTISGGNIGSTTITGSNLVNNIDLAGKHPTAGSQNIVVANTNDAQGLSIIRCGFNSAGTLITGSGASGAHTGTGVYDISFTTAFGDSPAVTITCTTTSYDSVATISSLSSSSVRVQTYGVIGAALADIPFQLIAIGMRQ